MTLTQRLPVPEQRRLTGRVLGQGLGLVTLEVSSNLGDAVNPSLLCCLFVCFYGCVVYSPPVFTFREFLLS